MGVITVTKRDSSRRPVRGLLSTAGTGPALFDASDRRWAVPPESNSHADAGPEQVWEPEGGQPTSAPHARPMEV